MPNHWHLVLWPKRGADNGLSEFMRWLTVAHNSVGIWLMELQARPLYQGRFKSFSVQDDEHFLTVCRYVEPDLAGRSRVANPSMPSATLNSQVELTLGRAVPGEPSR